MNCYTMIHEVYIVSILECEGIVFKDIIMFLNTLAETKQNQLLILTNYHVIYGFTNDCTIFTHVYARQITLNN